MTVSHHRRLIDCLAAVANTPSGLVRTSHAIVEQLQQLIPGDSYVLGYRRASDGAYYGFWQPHAYAIDRFGEAYHAHAHEHPFVRFFRRNPRGEAVRFSDLVSDRELREQPLFQEFFQPLGTRRLLGRVVPVPAYTEWIFNDADGGFNYPTNAPLYPFTTVSMAVGREGTEFSDEERFIFDRFVELAAAQFSRELRCELATRGALKPTPPINSSPPILSPFADLATTPAVDRVAQHHKLSPRETEVLRWLAAGKTNPEISIILGSGVRTIQSQVQSVFQKLGVENRLSAARAVWKVEVTGEL